VKKMYEPEEGIDTDWAVEYVSELVYEQGRKILEHFWNSGGPGAGAGSEELYEFKRMYFASPSDSGLRGPYDTLEDALDSNWGMLVMTDATEWLRSDPKVLPTPELVQRLEVSGRPRSGRITVNGEAWILQRGELVRAATAGKSR
jgi:hypothetical protein